MATKKMTGYPMPADIKYLMQHGHLMASEREEQGFHRMGCADCDGPVDLIYVHGPIDISAYTKAGRVLPGTVWGDDVTVICPKCSFKNFFAEKTA